MGAGFTQVKRPTGGLQGLSLSDFKRGGPWASPLEGGPPHIFCGLNPVQGPGPPPSLPQ